MLKFDLSQKDAKINEEEVWDVILQFVKWKNKRCTSPFRMDKSPDCYLYNKQGTILLFDPVEQKNYNVVTAYARLHNISTKESFKILINKNYESVIPSVKIKKQNSNQSNSNLIDISIKWTKSGKDYWSKIGVTELSNIHQINGYWLDGHYTSLPNVTFAYQYENRYKFYEPNYRRFFLGNVNRNSTWFDKNGSDTLFICKSAKDHKAIKSLLGVSYDYIHVQGESQYPDMKKYSYQNYIIFFDNDKPGMEGSDKLKTIIKDIYPDSNVTEIFIPDTNYKDYTDYFLAFGKAETFKLISKLLNF